jgi:hypothetical protein
VENEWEEHTVVWNVSVLLDKLWKTAYVSCFSVYGTTPQINSLDAIEARFSLIF